MPELPEVETVVRALRPVLSGRRIERLELLHPRASRHSDPARLEAIAAGASIVDVRRRGKFILIVLDGGRPELAVHLRMSGQLLLSREALPSLHVRAVFHLAAERGSGQGATGDGAAPPTRLSFVDIRTFGTLFALDGSEPPGFRTLGVEPLSSAFTPDLLRELLASSGSPVKSWLLRQDRIAGIGNIYASEACFVAKIHPSTEARRIGTVPARRLHTAIVEVLEKAVAQMGTTLSDFRRPDGSAGEYGNDLLVYGREGLPCPGCGQAIQRMVHHGRSTFFCSRCQHRPRRR